MNKDIAILNCLHYIILDIAMTYLGIVKKICLSSLDPETKRILKSIQFANIVDESEIDYIKQWLFYKKDKRMPAMAIGIRPLDIASGEIGAGEIAFRVHYRRGAPYTDSATLAYYFDRNSNFIRKQAIASH